MARLWTFGAELNSLTAGIELTSGSGTLNTVSTSIVRSGTYSVRVNPTAAFRWFGQVFKSSATSSKAYLRAYIYIATLPSSGECEVIGVWNSGAVTRSAHVRLLSNGSLRLYAGASTVGADSPALSTGTWYIVEMEVEGSGVGDNDIRARYGVGGQGSVEFAGTTTATVDPFDAAYFAAPNAASSFDMYWDDIAINDTSGSYQTSYPGEGKVIRLTPNAAGDNNDWLNTSAGAGSTSNYALVDEVTPNDATDMVQTNTINTFENYNVSASGVDAADTVSVVHIGARFRNNTADATTAFHVRCKKVSAGTVANSSDIVPNSTTWKTNNVTATARAYPLTQYVDPDGSAWTGGTSGTLDSMQIGVKCTVGGTNRIQVSTIWAMVDYAPTIYTFEQEGYRWRADDAGETSANWLASQDTNITRAKGLNTRLRILVNTTGNTPSTQYRLEFRKVGDSTWTTIS